LLCDRGISHFHNKNVEAALKDMDKAVELDSDNPYRYSSRAFIRAEVDVNGAMEDYEKAIELDPKDEISLNNLGLLQENAGKMKAAKKNFKKSNEIISYDPKTRQEKNNNRPQDLKLQNSLGKVMLSVFKSKETRKEYFQFIKSVFKKNT
jgi:Flp pilus assembly protein TadD